jgi:hypothetical protein
MVGFHHKLATKNSRNSPNPSQKRAENSKTRFKKPVRNCVYFPVSIFKSIKIWLLLSNELIVFTGLFLPSCSAQTS